MRSRDIKHLLSLALNSQETASDEDFDDYIDKLRYFFSENLLLAALDLIDRESVTKISTAWGYSHFQVQGSTATYTVFPETQSELYDMPQFCTCPAYAFSVILTDSELMCKHLLAVAVAQRTSRCIERVITKDQLADVVIQQCS